MYVYLKIKSYQRIKSPTPCFWFACQKLFGSGYPPPATFSCLWCPCWSTLSQSIYNCITCLLRQILFLILIRYIRDMIRSYIFLQCIIHIEIIFLFKTSLKFILCDHWFVHFKNCQFQTALYVLLLRFIYTDESLKKNVIADNFQCLLLIQ